MRFAMIGAVWAICLGLGAQGASAVEIVGAQNVQVAWAPASGDVSGYYLVVSRDGAAAALEGISQEPSETIEASFGETVVVQVAAFGSDGEAGPLSEPSEPISFIADAPDPSPLPLPQPEEEPPSDVPTSEEEDKDGTSQEPERSATPASRRPIHDFTCDGTSDLIVRETAYRYAIWEIKQGRYHKRISVSQTPVNSNLVGAGDYDGDGCADLLWQDRYTHRISIWRLVAGKVVDKRSLAAPHLSADEQWRVGGSGDIDADGTDDIVLYSRSAGALEVWMLEAAELREQVRLPGRTGDWTIPGLIDADADGASEILWYDESDQQLESFDPMTGETRPLWTMVAGWRPIRAADWDGDALEEVAAIETSGHGIVTLSPARTEGFVERYPGRPDLGTLTGGGDYDGDGIADFAWMHLDSGSVTLWLEGSEEEVVLRRGLRRGARLEAAMGTPTATY